MICYLRLFLKNAGFIDSNNNSVNDRIEISVYYTMPLMSASGVEIDFSNFGNFERKKIFPRVNVWKVICANFENNPTHRSRPTKKKQNA